MTIILFLFLSIFIYSLTPAKKQEVSALLIGFVMFLSAFFLTETNQYDLIAHRSTYDTIAKGGYAAAVTYSSVDGSPLFIWYLYVASFLGDNRYTSAIPTLVGYFILIYLLIQTSRKFNISKPDQICLLVFLFCILPWQDYTAGIRGALAYSCCCFGVYLEFRKNQKLLAAVFYVVPVFIHQAAIIFLFIRLLLYVVAISRIAKICVYILCLLAGSMVEFIDSIISNFASSSNLRILTIISDSFENYALDGGDIYEVSVVILRVLAVLLIYFLTRGHIPNETKSESSIFSIYTMLMLLSIGFIWQYDIVCRYTVACMMISPLILYRCNIKYIPILVIFGLLNLVRYYYSYYRHWEILY